MLCRPQLKYLFSLSANFAILGLPSSCSFETAKKKYYELAKLYHPDVNSTPNAQAKFTQITQVYLAPCRLTSTLRITMTPMRGASTTLLTKRRRSRRNSNTVALRGSKTTNGKRPGCSRTSTKTSRSTIPTSRAQRSSGSRKWARTSISTSIFLSRNQSQELARKSRTVDMSLASSARRSPTPLAFPAAERRRFTTESTAKR